MVRDELSLKIQSQTPIVYSHVPPLIISRDFYNNVATWGSSIQYLDLKI